MRDETILSGGMRVVLMDTISAIGPEEAGHVVVCGSHGGTVAAGFALRHPPRFVLFNDAGIGRDRAGIAGLALLDAHAIPAAALAHTSARIGDARDAWENGIVSHANDTARALGVREGMAAQDAVEAVVREG